MFDLCHWCKFRNTSACSEELDTSTPHLPTCPDFVKLDENFHEEDTDDDKEV